jgi:serralysin
MALPIENARGGQGNDVLIGNNGRNFLDGDSGIDTVLVTSLREHNTLSKNSSGYTLTANANPDNLDTLARIERLEFGDIGLALDLDGHAGQVAKLLGVVFGPHTVNNMEYVGIGLNEMDNGVGYELLGRTRHLYNWRQKSRRSRDFTVVQPVRKHTLRY